VLAFCVEDGAAREAAKKVGLAYIVGTGSKSTTLEISVINSLLPNLFSQVASV
jgi:hypothetical protein